MYIHFYTCVYTHVHTYRYVYTCNTILNKYKRVNEEQVNETVAGEGVGSLTGFSDCFSDGRLYHTFDANTSSREDDKTKTDTKSCSRDSTRGKA